MIFIIYFKFVFAPGKIHNPLTSFQMDFSKSLLVNRCAMSARKATISPINAGNSQLSLVFDILCPRSLTIWIIFGRWPKQNKMIIRLDYLLLRMQYRFYVIYPHRSVLIINPRLATPDFQAESTSNVLKA